jgi:hypothetical protein
MPTSPTASASSMPAAWSRRARRRNAVHRAEATPTPRTSSPACRASATPRAARRSRVGHPTSPIHRTGCRFHPRCPLAIDKCKTECRRSKRWDRTGHRSACWRWPRMSKPLVSEHHSRGSGRMSALLEVDGVSSLPDGRDLSSPAGARRRECQLHPRRRQARDLHHHRGKRLRQDHAARMILGLERRLQSAPSCSSGEPVQPRVPAAERLASWPRCSRCSRTRSKRSIR